ncbi:MAG: TIR domain-containing protein, partial [Candidatus Thiodiazotropha endolucinida]
MQTEHTPVFFISRAGTDRYIASAIAKILRDAGRDTWLQDEDFGHASFMARMAQGFTDDKRMIALLSRDYQQSEYCKKEYEQVLADDPRNLKERLLVFRIDDVTPSEHLKDLAYTDLVPVLSDASALTRVVRVAIGVEKSQVDCDFAALYRHSPQQIVHPEIEALRGFIGRDDELATLDSALGKTGQTNSVVVALTNSDSTAITGLGGVGKTFLAKYYAWRHRTDYQGLWWAHGELRQTLVDDLVALGARLIPGLGDRPDREAAARATLDHLAFVSSHEYPGAKPWLLIYDNVEAPEMVQGLIPQEGVRLLLTSRWSDWHDYATELPVGIFAPDIAVQFLLARSRDKDAKAAARLAEDLGYLPLALEHARSYCWSTHTNFKQYRARLADMIKKVPRQARYPQSVFATFDLALTTASEDAPASEQLIQLLSLYAPDAIPMTLVAAAMPYEDRRGDAIRSLTDLSLIAFGELDDGTATINIHRLVQEVARTRGEAVNTQIASQGLSALLTLWPGGNDGENPKYWPICRQLLPHALILLQRIHAIEDDLEQVALLKSYTAYYLDAIGRFKEAEPLYLQALEICQRVLGEEHPSTATSYNNVATNLNAQGRYAEAEPL